jgi:hypothetical protein
LLHVTIDREDKTKRLVFGVVVHGAGGSTIGSGANRMLGPTMGRFAGLRKFAYPVCLFFFTMGDDQAYFSWLAEPIVADGAPKLVQHEKARCVELTNEVLNEAVVADHGLVRRGGGSANHLSAQPRPVMSQGEAVVGAGSRK